jgi:predicted DNA-binding transcriptional regulator AlpA
MVTSQFSSPGSVVMVLLTPKETARVLRVSLSWLAKARMRGDGPPYIRIGRSIRYSEAAVLQWMKSRQRLSTNSNAGEPAQRRTSHP